MKDFNLVVLQTGWTYPGTDPVWDMAVTESAEESKEDWSADATTEWDTNMDTEWSADATTDEWNNNMNTTHNATMDPTHDPTMDPTHDPTMDPTHDPTMEEWDKNATTEEWDKMDEGQHDPSKDYDKYKDEGKDYADAEMSGDGQDFRMDFGDAGYIEGSQNGDETKVKMKLDPIDTKVEGKMRGDDAEVEVELPMKIEVEVEMDKNGT